MQHATGQRLGARDREVPRELQLIPIEPGAAQVAEQVFHVLTARLEGRIRRAGGVTIGGEGGGRSERIAAGIDEAALREHVAMPFEKIRGRSDDQRAILRRRVHVELGPHGPAASVPGVDDDDGRIGPERGAEVGERRRAEKARSTVGIHMSSAEPGLKPSARLSSTESSGVPRLFFGRPSGVKATTATGAAATVGHRVVVVREGQQAPLRHERVADRLLRQVDPEVGGVDAGRRQPRGNGQQKQRGEA